MIYTNECRARDMFLHRNKVRQGLEMYPLCLQTVSTWTLVWFNASFFCSREEGNYKSGTLDSTSRWSYYIYAVSAKKSMSWETPLVVVVVEEVIVALQLLLRLLFLLLLLVELVEVEEVEEVVAVEAVVAVVAFVDILRWNCCSHNHKLFSSLNFNLNSL
jgi:hypothetical protein